MGSVSTEDLWGRDATFVFKMEELTLRLQATPTLGLPMLAYHDAHVDVACGFRVFRSTGITISPFTF